MEGEAQRLRGEMERINARWLQLISDRMERRVAVTIAHSDKGRFLQQRGFDPEAVPYNYLDEPPRDLDCVQQNLTVVKSVLRVWVLFSLFFFFEEPIVNRN